MVKRKIKRKSDHDSPYYVYSLYGENAIKLGNYMYEDLTLFLDRKYEIFHKMKQSRLTEM